MHAHNSLIRMNHQIISMKSETMHDSCLKDAQTGGIRICYCPLSRYAGSHMS